MASERLFGSNILPACKYCDRVFQTLGEDKLLCRKRGIVEPNHKCRHFIYNPLLRVPPKPRALEKFEQSDFDINAEPPGDAAVDSAAPAPK